MFFFSTFSGNRIKIMNSDEKRNVVDDLCIETTIRSKWQSIPWNQCSFISRFQWPNTQLIQFDCLSIFLASDWTKNPSIGAVISNEKMHLLPVSKVRQISTGAKKLTAKAEYWIFFFSVAEKHHFAHTVNFHSHLKLLSKRISFDVKIKTEWASRLKTKQLKWEQRRIGGFSIFHFTKIYSDCCFYINQTTLLSLSVRLKLRNFTFRLFGAWSPPQESKKTFCIEFHSLTSVSIELDAVITNLIVLCWIYLKSRKLFTIFSTGPQYPIMSFSTYSIVL